MQSLQLIQTNITEEATLNVYDHYNPTDLQLSKDQDAEKTWGMSFNVDMVNCKIQESIKIKIKIKIKRNKIEKITDHFNEIKNLFSHEEKHYEDYKLLGLERYKALGKARREQRAVTTQMNNKTFKDTRPTYQTAIKNYGAKYGLIYKLKPLPVTKVHK